MSSEIKTIYMSNHVSIDDLHALHLTLPEQVHFVLFDKIEYKYNESKLKNRKVTVYEQFEANTIVELIKLVESGEPIFLFPEMKISKSGNLLRIMPEFSFLAHKSQAEIYPVFIHTQEKSLSLASIVETLVLNNKSVVKIGEPFNLKHFPSSSGETEKERISSYIHGKLNELKFSSINKTNVNLYNELLVAAKLHKDTENDYIVKDGLSGEVTYNKLLLNINVLSQRIEKVVSNENRVGVLMPNSIAHVVALYSLFKLGKTPAILNFTMGEQNLLDCCDNAELNSIITSKTFIEKANLEELIKLLSEKHRIIYMEDVKDAISGTDKVFGLATNYLQQKSNASNNEVILFTSGSENKPKGVILSHDNIYANVLQAFTSIDLTTKDKMFNSLPMFHSFGLSVGVFLPLIVGIPVYLYPSPTHSKEIPRLIYKESMTLFISTPTFLTHYEKYAHPSTFNDVRYVITGAERLKPEIKQTWMEKYGIRIIEGYGATEAAPIISLNTPLFNKAGSVGKVVPGLEFKVEPVDGIEEGGRLLIKGPNVMKGYLIHGEGFKPHEGWYNTGDIVDVDDFEFITIKSREKRFAKIGGEMVSLNLVEELAAKCFGHTGFASVAIPDKKKGERIILFTTVKEEEGFLKTQERTLKKFLKANKMSALHAPSDIEFVEEIQLLGSGKVDYVSIQKMALEMFK